jgi:hypothetical protein
MEVVEVIVEYRSKDPVRSKPLFIPMGFGLRLPHGVIEKKDSWEERGTKPFFLSENH